MPLGRVSVYFDDLGHFARHPYSSSNAHVLLVRANAIAHASLITILISLLHNHVHTHAHTTTWSNQCNAVCLVSLIRRVAVPAAEHQHPCRCH
jgi:hypothetical protein